MMQPLLVALRENECLAKPLAEAIGAELARLELRRFPDGETYLRYDTSPAGRPVIMLCSLDRPDDKFLALLFAAATARDLGAASVGLVSPYLAYMRQDRRFQPGEAVRSEEHTSELQSLMRISYAVFCLKKKNTKEIHHPTSNYLPKPQQH